jgi:2-oxoisovalerate dehydrogenase E1 component beta subunit
MCLFVCVVFSPITRVCGYDVPFPLAFERLYVPDALKLLDAVKSVVKF